MKTNNQIKNYIIKEQLDIKKVVQDYSGYVYTVVKNFSKGYLQEEDIEEIIADVFFILWNNRQKLKEDMALNPYLIGISKNLISRYRKNKLNISIEDYENELTDNIDINRICEQNEKLILIEKSLNNMKDIDVQIFKMYYYSSKKIKEIAKELNITEVKVKTKLYRIRNKIKKDLEKGDMEMQDNELNNRIWNKVETKIAVSNFQKEEKRVPKMKILQMVATFIMSIGITIGVVYAGYTVYENVWREPKIYQSYDELINDIRQLQGSQEITAEDEEKAVNKEEAEIEANKILQKLDYEDVKFVNAELKKNYFLGAELVYYFTTNEDLNKGIQIGINAENGKCIAFADEDLKYTKINPDKIDKEQAKLRAKEIYDIFGLENKGYELKKIEEIPYCFQDEETNEWYATYCKTYDGAFNYFERFELFFAIENGKMKLSRAYLANEKVEFENNPIVITKEKAEEIAKEQDKKLTDNEIESVVTKLQIREMNSWIYALEQNGGNIHVIKKYGADGEVITYPKYEVTQNIARKVWTVCIHYKKREPDPENQDKYNSKCIFVDVTTGEVIGGSDEHYWD